MNRRQAVKSLYHVCLGAMMISMFVASGLSIAEAAFRVAFASD